MRRASVGVCVLGSVLLLPLPAFAQADAAPTAQPELRKWDAGGSFGYRLNGNSFLLPSAAWTLDVGRYWTVHLKTDVWVVAPMGLSVAMTYQAFDNVFVHPYVSGGVRRGEVEAQYTDASVARPFVAAGFKSYFSNGRTFLRAELIAVGGPRGPALMPRLGVGVDF